MKINKIIKEEINKFMINESLTNVVYHFTSIFSLKNIVFNDAFRLSYAHPGLAEFEYTKNGKYQYFMSFTRQRDGRLGFSMDKEVRIEIDGGLLNQNFKGEPISFFSSLNNYMKKNKSNNHHIPFDLKYQEETENEDRLFTNKPSIPNVKKYIKRIDIFLHSQRDASFIKWLLTESDFKDIVYVYDDEVSFQIRNDKNNINRLIINNSHDTFNFSNSYDRNNDYTVMNGVSEYSIREDISNAILFILLNQNINPRTYNDNKLREIVSKILKKYKINAYTNLSTDIFNNIIDMIKIYAPKNFDEVDFDQKTEWLLDFRQKVFNSMSGLGNYRNKRLISNISNLVKNEVLNIN